jgi:hypothetical protein
MARSARARPAGAPGGIAASIDELQNIAALIEDGGQVSLGSVGPIPCAAVASDDHNALAMLKRRPGESLQELLARLDAAIGSACNNSAFIDEINSPPNLPSSKSRRR